MVNRSEKQETERGFRQLASQRVQRSSLTNLDHIPIALPLSPLWLLILPFLVSGEFLLFHKQGRGVDQVLDVVDYGHRRRAGRFRNRKEAGERQGRECILGHASSGCDPSGGEVMNRCEAADRRPRQSRLPGIGSQDLVRKYCGCHFEGEGIWKASALSA